jgi:hypothetical protein
MAALASGSRGLAIYFNRDLFWQGFAGDSSIHFTIIRQLKKDSGSWFIDQYLIRCEPMSYPTAYHRYCKLFPLGLIESRPYLPNLVLYIAFTAGFGAYFHYVSVGLMRARTELPALLAVAAFLLLPGQYVFAGPSLAYISLSERFLARLSTGAFFACSFVASQFHDAVSLSLAAAVATVGFLVSLFSRQALIFITPLMSLLLLDWTPLIVLVAGFILALALSRSYFVLSMKHTAQQWALYATHAKRSAVIRANLSRFVDWRDLCAAHSLRGFAWRLIQYEPGRSLLYFPEISLSLMLVVLAAVTKGSLGGISAWAWAAPFAAAIIVFLLTATEKFNHLGESYRYLEYGLYFLSPMAFGSFAIEYGPHASWLLAFLVLLGLPSAALVYVLFGRWVKKPARDLMKELIEGMELPQGAVVFPVGMPVAADVCARRADVKSFWYQPGLISKDIYAHFLEGWPFLKLDGGPIIEKFDVTHAIVDKGYLQYLPGACRLPHMKLEFESERYLGYTRIWEADPGSSIDTVVILEKPQMPSGGSGA